MIQGKILKKIIPLVVNHLFGKSKRFKAIFDYVHKPNNLDIDMVVIRKRLEDLERDSHPPLFKKEHREDILERLEKLEEKCG